MKANTSTYQKLLVQILLHKASVLRLVQEIGLQTEAKLLAKLVSAKHLIGMFCINATINNYIYLRRKLGLLLLLH